MVANSPDGCRWLSDGLYIYIINIIVYILYDIISYYIISYIYIYMYIYIYIIYYILYILIIIMLYYIFILYILDIYIYHFISHSPMIHCQFIGIPRVIGIHSCMVRQLHPSNAPWVLFGIQLGIDWEISGKYLGFTLWLFNIAMENG